MKCFTHLRTPTISTSGRASAEEYNTSLAADNNEKSEPTRVESGPWSGLDGPITALPTVRQQIEASPLRLGFDPAPSRRGSDKLG